MSSHKLLFVWLLVLFTPIEVRVPASDWPQFLGPTRNGISPETGLLEKWPSNGPPVVWAKEIGTGYSAPSIRGNQLVLFHRIGGDEIVESFEADSGKPLWRYSYPSKFIDPFGYNNGPRCTPQLSETACYTFGAEGMLTCLDLKTGKMIWQRNTSQEWEIPEAFFGVGSTPLLDGNRLYVMIGGQPNSGMAALDAKTGKTIWESIGEKNWSGVIMSGYRGEPPCKWKRDDKQASYSSPALATIHGRTHLLCLMRQGLVSLDPANGNVNFSFWFRSPVNESVNAMNPVVVDDLIFLSACYYKIGSALLRVQPGGKGVDLLGRSSSLEIHFTTPIYHDGFLYAFSGRNEPDAHFRCVEFKTGKIMWDRDESWTAHSGQTPKVYGRGSAILADGKLIVLGEGGMLGLFRPNRKEPEEISHFQVSELHYPSWAAPVLSNKRLYLRNEDHLVCLGLGK